MKQKAQWLSQVRIRRKTAEDTSTPKGPPGALSIGGSRGRGAPARLTMTLRSSASVSCWKSMTSRGSCPLKESSSSPTTTPARAAGDAAVTEVTVGADIDPGYSGLGPTRSSLVGSAESAAVGGEERMAARRLSLLLLPRKSSVHLRQFFGSSRSLPVGLSAIQ